MVNRYNLYLYLLLGAFWVLSCTGFLGEELFPFLLEVRNGLFALCDVVFVILGLLTLRDRGDKIVFWSFMTLGFVSTVIVNKIGLFNLFNGARDFLGLIFAIPILRWFMTHERREEFKQTMDKVLTWWLWLQAVTITIQFIEHGAGDWGGGTMGSGASGMVSTSIYVISFFLIVRRWDSDHYFRSLWRNKMYVFLLYPTFLNETKVSFILLFAYFILLVKFDKQMIVKVLYIIPMAIVAFIGLGSIYLTVTEQDAEDLLSEEFYTNYFYGQDLDFLIEVAMKVQDGTIEVDPRDWWAVDIPRFAKLVLINPEVRDCSGGVALGAGLGQFKGWSMAEPPRFARLNEWLLNGSRPWIFFMYVQLGLLGYIWYICVTVRNMRLRGSRYPSARKVFWLILLMIMIIQFYNDSLRFFNFDVLIMYMTLYMQLDVPDEDTNQKEAVVATE